MCAARGHNALPAQAATPPSPRPSPDLKSEDLRPPNLYDPASRLPGCNAPRLSRSEGIGSPQRRCTLRTVGGRRRRAPFEPSRAPRAAAGPLALPLPWRASTSWPLSLVHDRGSLAPHQQRFAVKLQERQQRSRPRALPHQYIHTALLNQPTLSLTLARAALDRSINRGVHRTAPRPAHRGPRSTWRSIKASEGPLAQR